jgi:nucleoside-diphosphate-sugar epimerase
VSLIGSLLGKDIEIAPDQERVRPEDSEVERLCADNRKARRLLGWQPSHTLEEGLARTIEWVRENINRYRLGAYAV